MLLQGKVIIVTGGSGLLGRSICRSICSEGGHPISLDIVTIKDPEFESYAVDISDEHKLKSIVDSISTSHGAIHGAVHAAYPRSPQWGETIENLTIERLTEDLRLQLGSALIFSKIMLGIFQTQKFGSFE